ncbi:MAG: hypothetical protein OEM89_00810 [Nitrosopumilus sp.]|nr:hypothetical protein [Nitrosopumilus sp.]
MQITSGKEQIQGFLTCKFMRYKMTQDFEEILFKLYGVPFDKNYEKYQRKKEYFKKIKFRGRF